jgi:hypothetical protein
MMKKVLAVVLMLGFVFGTMGMAAAFECDRDVVYIDYGPANLGEGGVWKYEMGDFTRITTSDPENMLATEYGLIGDFGASGTWLYDGSGWVKISEDNPQQMVK